MTEPTTPQLTESKPDIKAALRKLQDAAWNCGTDEYRDGVSDAACTRRHNAMVTARAECVSAADALLTENAALREQFAEIEQDRLTLIYWLLRAYNSGHREGWEEGPSTDETMHGLLCVLANRGYDPNLSDDAKVLLKTKPRY